MDQKRLLERAVSGLHESLLARLPDTLNSSSPILDVGCGSGAWLERLFAAGYRNLTGIDLDISQQQTDHANVGFADLNAKQWDVPGKNYHLITAIEVIEHLDNLGLFLDNIRDLLDEEGFFLATTPNIHSLAARLRFFLLNDMKQFGSLGDPTHITPILSATIDRILPTHDLQLIDWWGYPDTGRTLTSRGFVNWMCQGLRLVLPEPVPGDVFCILIKKHS